MAFEDFVQQAKRALAAAHNEVDGLDVTPNVRESIEELIASALAQTTAASQVLATARSGRHPVRPPL